MHESVLYAVTNTTKSVFAIPAPPFIVVQLLGLDLQILQTR